jgi:hypothetical protein
MIRESFKRLFYYITLGSLSLPMSIKWTKEDKDLLVKYVQEGLSYPEIAKKLKKFTIKACKCKYYAYLQPGIKRGKWDPSEDRQLMDWIFCIVEEQLKVDNGVVKGRSKGDLKRRVEVFRQMLFTQLFPGNEYEQKKETTMKKMITAEKIIEKKEVKNRNKRREVKQKNKRREVEDTIKEENERNYNESVASF